MRKMYKNETNKENCTGGNNDGEEEGHASRFQESSNHFHRLLNGFRKRYDVNNKKVYLSTPW
jgi:hypothetical protein